MKPPIFVPEKIFGILGFPLAHTLSPILHNGIYQAMGIPASYHVFQIHEPKKEDILRLHAFGLRGLSVTIPHKEWAFRIADSCDPSATRMKSANTLLVHEGRIEAYNTDGLGALQSILAHDKDLLDPFREGDILILGSGGSARGIGFAILEYFLQILEAHPGKSLAKNIVLSARNTGSALALAQEMNQYLPQSTYFIPLSEMQANQPQYVELLIHTTSVGMKGQETECLLPSSSLHPDMTVFDIVYNPHKTLLIRQAKKLGCDIIYGIDMLVYQGVRQIELFTGESPRPKLIRKIKKEMMDRLP